MRCLCALFASFTCVDAQWLASLPEGFMSPSRHCIFQVRDYIKENLGGVGPRFVGILANSDPAARKYAEWTSRACSKDGIRYEVSSLFSALYMKNLVRAAMDLCSQRIVKIRSTCAQRFLREIQGQ